MQTEILYRPSYSLAVVKLNPNETLQVEGGAMVSMTPDLKLETKAKGGILKSLARSVLGGESFFMNTYTAPSEGGEITLAPALPGDVQLMELQNEVLMVQSGSYVASSQASTWIPSGGAQRPFSAVRD